jgi:hypothetical protein
MDRRRGSNRPAFGPLQPACSAKPTILTVPGGLLLAHPFRTGLPFTGGHEETPRSGGTPAR